MKAKVSQNNPQNGYKLWVLRDYNTGIICLCPNWNHILSSLTSINQLDTLGRQFRDRVCAAVSRAANPKFNFLQKTSYLRCKQTSIRSIGKLWICKRWNIDRRTLSSSWYVNKSFIALVNASSKNILHPLSQQPCHVRQYLNAERGAAWKC